MANALDALIDRIPDEALRGQIREALKKQNQQKKFGLVFEDRIPESTVLYDVPVKAGSTVALRGGDVSKQMKVLAIDGEVAHCLSLPEREPVDQPLDSLVSVAKFGEPIYPYLKQLDTVCNAPDSDLWHTLIEADNYHALQLLEYLYAEKVDCIYIDPPYNTGEDEWKYTNHLYVDPNTGIAKIKLNTWEDGVLREEMRRPDFVCWLRNVSRAQWALCLPYDYNGEKKGFYPDMMIVRKHPQYGYVVDVLEPHMPRYDDNLPKAKALAQYSKDEPHVIRLQLIHEKTDLTGHKRYVRLDLQKSEIREKVLASSTPDDLKNIFVQFGEFSAT